MPALTKDQVTAVQLRCDDLKKTIRAYVEAGQDAGTIAMYQDEYDGLQRLLSRPGERKTRSEDPATQNSDHGSGGGSHGYATPRHFLEDVYRAGLGGGVSDRLRGLAARAGDSPVLAAVGSDEHSTFSDPHGGFLVPSGFSPELAGGIRHPDPLAPLVRHVAVDRPSMVLPSRVDKDHSTSVSGGLRVYRRAEAGEVDASRMEMEAIKLQAQSLFGVTYATEEILTDSLVAFVTLLQDGFRDEFASRLMNERLEGTGVGEFLGVMNSDCQVTVPKESGQAADSIVAENVLNMRARCWGYRDAVWIANDDCYTELAGIHMAGTNGDVFLFHPGNGSDVPDTLLGRPIIFTEYAKTLGDLGDLVLGNWSQYMEGTYEPMKTGESIHVRYIQHERCFKFWMRNDGQPWWRSQLTPKYGANTLSPFVTLAARA